MIGLVENGADKRHRLAKGGVDALLEGEIGGAAPLAAAAHLNGDGVAADAEEGDTAAVTGDAGVDFDIDHFLNPFPNAFLRRHVLKNAFGERRRSPLQMTAESLADVTRQRLPVDGPRSVCLCCR